jgi:hypothetical protein
METGQVPYMEIAAGVLGGLWVVSEALAQVPSIRANSVFQAIYNVLQKMQKKKDPA